MKSATAMIGMSLSLTLVARLPAQPTKDGTTFDAVQNGRVCAPSQDDPRRVDCDFQVGRSLRFIVIGVGLPEGGLDFVKADYEGDYYGSTGFASRCVIISPGAATTKDQPSRAKDLAYVSPVDGRVYRDLPSCRAAK